MAFATPSPRIVCTSLCSGRYALDMHAPVLGKGAHGRVWPGLDRVTGERVAVKVVDLRLHYAAFMHERDALERLARCKDMPVAAMRAHMVDAEHELGYLVLDRIDAPSLATYIKTQDGTLRNEDEALAIFERILLAVAQVLACGVAHHDLKPDNILYDPSDGRVTLIDWGLSHLLDMHGRCVCGTGPGTPVYMAPEILHATSPHDATRSETWSLAIVLYELLVGEAPYRTVRSLSTLKKTLASGGPWLPRSISPALRHVMRQMLGYAPANRPSLESVAEQVSLLRMTTMGTCES
jgi:serine/threonine protein kinase